MNKNDKMQAGPVTVVVAEKNPLARAALAAMLTQDGYRVFQAASFKEAIFHIDSLAPPGVLLADLDMPGWRSMVQQAISSAGALVISMAGSHPFPDNAELQQRGIRVCLTKPVVYKDVQRALRENIDTKDAAESASSTGTVVAHQPARKPVLT